MLDTSNDERSNISLELDSYAVADNWKMDATIALKQLNKAEREFLYFELTVSQIEKAGGGFEPFKDLSMLQTYV